MISTIFSIIYAIGFIWVIFYGLVNYDLKEDDSDKWIYFLWCFLFALFWIPFALLLSYKYIRESWG